jgi:hypothetical protein
MNDLSILYPFIVVLLSVILISSVSQLSVKCGLIYILLKVKLRFFLAAEYVASTYL